MSLKQTTVELIDMSKALQRPPEVNRSGRRLEEEQTELILMVDYGLSVPLTGARSLVV